MGLFSKKEKFSVDGMAMQAMLGAIEGIGKLAAFNDVDERKSMAVSMGYFYGFLKLHLNSITKLDTVNTIIYKSITNVEEALKGKSAFDNFGHTVRNMANNASANMQYVMKETKNPFQGMAIFYLKDLYDSTTIDMGKIESAEKNMRLLYKMTSLLTQNIKITKE